METSLGHRLAQVYTPPGGPGRIQPLEGARGAAALLVFLVHFEALSGTAFFQFAVTIGHSGVDLLFVISGYLIYGGLFRKPSGYGRFLFHRLRRIYPVFLCVFAAYLFLHLAVPPAPQRLMTGIYLLENLAMLPGLFDITPLITVA